MRSRESRGECELCLAVVLIVVCVFNAPLKAAELGDINGDGRVSFADAHLLAIWNYTLDDRWRPAEGSYETLGDVFPCTASLMRERGERPWNYVLAELVYEEALRRASVDPLPHLFEQWPDGPGDRTEPPQPDPRVEIEVEGAQILDGAGERTALVTVRVVAFEPLDGLSLVFRVEGLDVKPRNGWNGATGSPRMMVSVSDWYYLTRGSLGLRTQLFPQTPLTDLAFPPGEYVVEMPVLLPPGAEPGSYALEVLPGTEAVIDDREAIVPRALSGVLELARPPSGRALPFPDLSFIDGDEPRIDGQLELRVTEASGAIGDEVVVFVDVKADRPVNRFDFTLNFLRRKLHLDAAIPLLENATEGRLVADEHNPRTGSPHGFDTDWLWYSYRSSDHGYVWPLGEWLPFAELRFTVLEGAAGSDAVTLNLFSTTPPSFSPYRDGNRGSCDGWVNAPAVAHPAEIVILDDSEPPPPPPPPVDPGLIDLRVALGEATAAPGEIVALPVTVESADDLWQLRFVLGFDPALLEPIGFEVAMIDPDGDPAPTFRLDQEDWGFVNEKCGPHPENPDDVLCITGMPAVALLHGEPRAHVPDGHLVVDLITTFLFGDGLFYPGPTSWEAGTRHEVGAALFRVREGVTAERIDVHGAELAWFPEGAPEEVTSVTSGNPLIVPRPDRPDVPAIEVTPGVIHVLGAQVGKASFLRGDADLSGAAELTDVIFALNDLFLAGPDLRCADAADTNDDGVLDLTDAVYELTYLFLEGPEPALPFPEVGVDPTSDALDCTEGPVP